jgi:hypothetical protein
MKKIILLAFTVAACSTTKAPTTDDFSSLAGVDEKSDSFSKRMKIVGSLSYGDTSDSVAYHNPPRYRAFKFVGSSQDQVDVWVRSADGDSVAWLLDGSYKTVARNDDADDTTTDSHMTATLAGAGTYYIVFREYSLGDATFDVSLAGTAANDFFSCQVDSDCVAVPVAGCCNNGWKIAVNQGQVDAYDAANACTTPHPICPLYIVNDTRVAECSSSTHKCEMIDPTAIRCGGFVAHPHQCPTGYQCHYTNVPDVPGTCVAKTCVDNIDCIMGTHWDSTACTCVADAP